MAAGDGKSARVISLITLREGRIKYRGKERRANVNGAEGGRRVGRATEKKKPSKLRR